MKLEEFYAKNPRFALGFSGGVDSSYLLYSAVNCGVQIQPYFIKTQFQTDEELAAAQKFAEELGCTLKILRIDVLNNADVVSNPPDRCYYCKKVLFGRIKDEAKKDGFSIIADGTNASDDISDRPGFRALEELGVLSPLRICGITKTEIREKLKKAGLSVWNAPSNACLATRIPTGAPITEAGLSRVNCSENALKAMGFSDLRVRSMGRAAKLELTGEQLERAAARRRDVLCALKPYYDSVYLDLKER